MLNFKLFRIDKSDGREEQISDVRHAVARIAGHLNIDAAEVYERLERDRSIETDFSIYKYVVC